MSQLAIKQDLPSPVVVIEQPLLEQIEKTEADAQALAIGTPEQVAHVTAVHTQVTRLLVAVEKSRALATKPFLEMQRAIKKASDGVTDRLNAVKRKTAAKLNEHHDAERKRQEEEARQRAAAERLRIEEEEKRKAEALKSAEPLDLDFDDASGTTITPAKIPEVTPPRVKVQDITYRTRLIYEVQDVNALPEAFIIRAPDTKKLSLVSSQWKDGNPLPIVPGVTFSVQRTPVANTRANTDDFF